jgi:hypothetical protein
LTTTDIVHAGVAAPRSQASQRNQRHDAAGSALRLVPYNVERMLRGVLPAAEMHLAQREPGRRIVGVQTDFISARFSIRKSAWVR